MLDRTKNHRNVDWVIPTLPDGQSVSQMDAHLSVLMDIRQELRNLNYKLECWRVNTALAALQELGVSLRRQKRNRRRKRT